MKNQKNIQLYTDGSCSGNPGEGAWACVLLYNGHKRIRTGYESYTTNNRMELSAVIQGLTCIKVSSCVDIFTDSQYVKNAFTQNWIDNWQKNQWKTADKKDVKNQDLWQELLHLVKQHRIQWYWVKGHSGDRYNELCDQLARNTLRDKKVLDEKATE